MNALEHLQLKHRVSGLYQFESQLWPDSKASDSVYDSVQMLETVLALPELAAIEQAQPFFQPTLERWSAHVDQIVTLRNSLIEPSQRTDSPISDINRNPQALHELLRLLQVPEEAFRQIKLSEEYQHCLVFRYHGSPQRFGKLFGEDVNFAHDTNGFYFHVMAVEVEPWLRNSVIWTFEGNWPSSPKNRPTDSYIQQHEIGTRRHEFRHFLDFFYHDWPTITDPHLQLEWRILLELAATVGEHQTMLYSSETPGLVLRRVPKELRQPLDNNPAELAATKDQLERILQIMKANPAHQYPYWSIIPTQAMSLDNVEEFVQR